VGNDTCVDLLEVGYGPTSKEELCVSRGVVGGVVGSRELVGREFTDPRPIGSGTSFDSSENCSGITVSRAPARALRALSRRFRG
jgi:hypothetical protein